MVLSLGLRSSTALRGRARRNLRIARRQLNLKRAKTTASQATSKRSNLLKSDTSLVFSPGGFLVSYYLGKRVFEALGDLDLIDSTTPICGTSAGALAAAFAISDMSHDECTAKIKQVQEKLLIHGYGWKVINILEETLHDCLPEDSHHRANGRVGIGVSVYSKRRLFGRVLTQFDSRLEFIQSILASCYIPYYLGPKLGIKWKDGSVYSDGMPTSFFPHSPSLARKRQIMVSAYPANNRKIFDNRPVDISPDLRPLEEMPGFWKVVWNGLVPLKTHEIDNYRSEGFSDTMLWAKQSLEK